MDAAIAILLIIAIIVFGDFFKFRSWRHWRNDSEDDAGLLVECNFVYVVCDGGCGNSLLTVSGRKPMECAKCWERRREVSV